MRYFLILVCFICRFAIAVQTDFDCVVVGTSPICMFEALYKHYTGSRVLVVEQASECGGAWKSIDICGVAHADMGCHEMGNDQRIKAFLEEHLGCKVVANAPSQGGQAEQGIYLSQGCYELVHKLQAMIEASQIPLLLNHKLESVYIDKEKGIAEVKIKGKRYTTSKILVSQGSEINMESFMGQILSQANRSKYPHVYLLIEDHALPKFTYMHFSFEGISRAMNMTQFVGLEGSGKQLIAFQVHGEQFFNKGEEFLNRLKQSNLVSQESRILQSQTYLYEQASFNMSTINQYGPTGSTIFEFINAGHIFNISMHMDKWRKVIPRFCEILNL